MGKRVVWGDFNEVHEARVYWDAEYREYRAVVRVKGDRTYTPVAEYFTDDRDDAIATAKVELAAAGTKWREV